MITRLCIAFALCSALLVIGCGGGATTPTDGDNSTDCPPGTIWNEKEGKCIQIEGEDGDVDGDEDPELNESSGEGDKDIVEDDPDNELFEPDDDFDWGELDRDLDERELENPIEVERPDQACECREDEDCGLEGYICIDNCWCVQEEGDQEPCVPCENHDQCDPGKFCDIDTGCCSSYVRPPCESNDDCPLWSYCTPTSECDYFCLEDILPCDPALPCCLRGQCIEEQFCIDGDEEEEIDTEIVCSSCEDCRSVLGNEYFCNPTTQSCEIGECCYDNECTDQENGICNVTTGECIYFKGFKNVRREGGGFAATNANGYLIRFHLEYLAQNKQSISLEEFIHSRSVSPEIPILIGEDGDWNTYLIIDEFKHSGSVD